MIITVLIIVLIYSNRGFVLIYYIVGTKSIIMKCKREIYNIRLNGHVHKQKPLNTECYLMKLNSIRYEKNSYKISLLTFR